MKRGRDPRRGPPSGGTGPGRDLGSPHGGSGKRYFTGSQGGSSPRSGPDQDKSMKGLILAQSERWRRGLGMQVERETGGNPGSKAAKG